MTITVRNMTSRQAGAIVEQELKGKRGWVFGNGVDF